MAVSKLLTGALCLHNTKTKPPTRSNSCLMNQDTLSRKYKENSDICPTSTIINTCVTHIYTFHSLHYLLNLEHYIVAFKLYMEC